MSIDTAWIIDTDTLEKKLNDKDLLVVDMTSESIYSQLHIPGAVFLNYANVIRHAPPVFGLLPETEAFSQTLSSLGITPDTYIVAYDDEGGGKASRLLWTMAIAGHKKMSLLDGGIHAWLADKKSVSTETPSVEASNYPVSFDNTSEIVDADYIKSQLGQRNVCILDTRSENEFIGTDKRASRAGHIPGAINIDWTDIKNAENAQRLKPQEALKEILASSGVSAEQEIITHCHSHHRSALMYVALKSLGYNSVKGYPGSWSDWAERSDMPVEV